MFAALLVLALGLGFAVARAEERVWPMDMPLPQDALIPVNMRTIDDKREDIQQAMVVVQMGHGAENPRWMMSQTQLQVFLNKLLFEMPDKPTPEDDIWPKLKPIEPHYKGITVVMQMLGGKSFEPLKIYEGRVSGPGGELISADFGRRLEYWMFGTARVRRDQLLGVNVLPVLSFEQCRLMGQKIVETSPRQCLLPDNNLLLETSEQPTLKSARLKDFDGCLKDGKALIYTFPRRCVAAGGRVFTEPPRLADDSKVVGTPKDAPLAAVPAEASPTMSGLKLKELIVRSVVTQTAVVSPGVMVAPPGYEMVPGPVPSATVPAGVPAGAAVPVGMPGSGAIPGAVAVSATGVSGSLALSEADLAKISPAAGPEGGVVRWFRKVWRIPLADFGY